MGVKLSFKAVSNRPFFFKAKHPFKYVVFVIDMLRVCVRIGVMAIEKLNDMKSAAVDVKVNVSRFKIRRYRFPHSHVGI